MEFTIQIIIGVIGGLITAAILRYFGHFFDLVPRQLHDLGIGSSFEPFIARGAGDNYNDVMLFRLQNHSVSPIYIIRAVYFPHKTKIPIYSNAVPSQKYKNSFEVKFGNQWKELAYLLMEKAETHSYIPLARSCSSDEFPQGERGELRIEYVHDGKTGIHKAKL